MIRFDFDAHSGSLNHILKFKMKIYLSNRVILILWSVKVLISFIKMTQGMASNFIHTQQL